MNICRAGLCAPDSDQSHSGCKKKRKKEGEFQKCDCRCTRGAATRANPPGLFCGCKRWLLKVGWTFSLQGTDGYIHLLSVLLILFVAKRRGLRSEPPPCVSPGEERNTVLCLHELFLKCCVFNLMLRVTNYLKTGTVFVRWMRLNSLQMWTLWFFYDNSLQNKRVK